MNTYKRHRFPPDIISYAVWLYYRFNLSHRDIEDLLAERGITVSREAIRLWCIKFGAIFTRRFKRLLRSHGGEPIYGGFPYLRRELRSPILQGVAVSSFFQNTPMYAVCSVEHTT